MRPYARLATERFNSIIAVQQTREPLTFLLLSLLLLLHNIHKVPNYAGIYPRATSLGYVVPTKDSAPDEQRGADVGKERPLRYCSF